MRASPCTPCGGLRACAHSLLGPDRPPATSVYLGWGLPSGSEPGWGWHSAFLVRVPCLRAHSFRGIMTYAYFYLSDKIFHLSVDYNIGGK